jgi:hypothetical protein
VSTSLDPREHKSFRDALIDNPGATLGIAEAVFNNAHQSLLQLEEAMKRGVPFEEVETAYSLLLGEVVAIEGCYRDVIRNPHPGAAECKPAFVERLGS